MPNYVMSMMLEYVELDPLFFKPFKNVIREGFLKRSNRNRVQMYPKKGVWHWILSPWNNQYSDHYNLVDDAWLKLFYAYNDTFGMRIEDMNLEVSYPVPAKTYEVSLEYYTRFNHADYETNSANEDQLYKTIVLTQKQATCNNMVAQSFNFLQHHLYNNLSQLC